MNYIGIIESLTKSSAIRHGDLDVAIHEILVKAAEGLQVARVNVWTIDPKFTALTCIGSIEKGLEGFSKGQLLPVELYPNYFKHISGAEKIVSDDAVSASFNKELLDSYILPLGIRSMMDIPVRIEGEMVGLVCFEHVGEKRLWTISEQSFAISIAQMLSLCMETHRRNELHHQLEIALHEKEVLLNEINHRVKNNMMIICSLINLQKYKAKDEFHEDLLDEVRSKILSMAYIHEQLYTSKNYAQIDFGVYLENLLSHLNGSMGVGMHVNIDKNIQHVPIAIKKAIPFGLITNEVVTNAFKYAFKPGKPGILNVRFEKNNTGFHLAFKDNGPGFDSKNEKRNSIGLGLVEDLVEQLEGQIAFDTSNGTLVEIHIPDQSSLA